MTDAPCSMVLITWVDSSHPVGKWQHLSKLGPEIAEEKPSQMVTLGWLLRCDDEIAILAQSLGSVNDISNMQAGGVMRIPRCSITEIRYLEEGKLATKLGKGFSFKNGKIEKVPVFHNASQKAKYAKANRSKTKVARARKS